MSESGEESVYQHKRNGSAETSCPESDAEDLKSYTSLTNETDSGVSNTGSIDLECIPHVTKNGMVIIDEDIISNGNGGGGHHTSAVPGMASENTGMKSFMSSSCVCVCAHASAWVGGQWYTFVKVKRLMDCRRAGGGCADDLFLPPRPFQIMKLVGGACPFNTKRLPTRRQMVWSPRVAALQRVPQALQMEAWGSRLGQ